MLIESALVLGCRCGQECFALQEEFDCHTLGVDIVPEFLRQARQYTLILEADMHALPIPDKSYDLVFCAGTLEHCYNPQQAVNEMCRIARKVIYVGMDLEEDREDYPSHYSFSTDLEEWKTLFKDQPFKIMKSRVESRALHLYLNRVQLTLKGV
jgi:ubiquinone/menaquinone biosynthesis C-methylase UbiE